MRRKLDKDLAAVRKIDWARLAAYIDGEGCIDVCKTQKQMYLRVFVCNTDPRLVVWCRDTFGGALKGKPRENREAHRPCYQWTVVSRVARDILLGCLPYFIIKKEQAEVGLAFQSTLKPSGRRRASDATVAFRTNCHTELQRMKRIVRPSPLESDPTVVH